MLRIRINPVTLRELMLFKSLYVCKTLTDIVDIVNDQPNPSVFYKSCLELDMCNMVSILSFDTRSMKYLLDDQFENFFDVRFPIFYKNKIQKGKDKFFYRNAIDSALRSNQMGAVQVIVDYIRKYQNNIQSSFLFMNNFADLVDRGTELQ